VTGGLTDQVQRTGKLIVRERRTWLRIAFLGSLCWSVRAAQAESDRPLKLVVPFSPGGGNDVFARALAKGLTDLRGQAVVVENKPGAGGNMGTAEVVRSPPDGYTLLLGHSGTVSINPVLYKGLKFDARMDLQPVAMFAQSALVLVVPANSTVDTVAGLIAEAKAASGAWNFSSAGAGTGGHLTGELFQQITGIAMRHIPYKGTAPALADVAASQVQMCFSVLPPALALIKASKLKAIAVTSSARLPSLPQVPTLAESGLSSLKGFESIVTYGLLAPAGITPAKLRELEAQILKVAATNDFQVRLATEGAVPMLGGSAEYARLIKSESGKWAEVVRLSGASVN
jgi:tripartite-type tricarboxylate transporter receptor subunit TctC